MYGKNNKEDTMKRCYNCDTILEDDELFCHECGAKQEILQEKQPCRRPHSPSARETRPGAPRQPRLLRPHQLPACGLRP